MIFYLGTYTEGTDSKGIYTLEFNEETLKLEILNTTMSVNPSFLARDKDMLYAANEMRNQSGYTKFLIEEDYSLKLMQQLLSEGYGTCHIAVNNDINALFLANYSSGDIVGFRPTESSKEDVFTFYIKYSGSGPNERRQKAPYAHSTNISPNGKHLVVTDLGTDKLMVYDILGDGNIRDNEENATVYVGPGEGPRHLCFHPTQSKLYVVTELLNSVISFDYDSITGGITRRDVFSILPEGFTTPSTSAEICLSKDAKFLYASNRGWDGIAAFAVDNDGNISPSGFYESFGKTPRSFMITDDDRYFVIAYQDSDLVVIVQRDINTGAMGDIIASISIPSPVCIIPF